MRIKFIVSHDKDHSKYYLVPTLNSWVKIQDYYGRYEKPWFPTKRVLFARKREEK